MESPKPEAPPEVDRDALSRTHAEAYSSLVDFYASVSDDLTRVRTECQRLVLLGELGEEQGIGGLEGVERLALPLAAVPFEASILDVGCGRGDNLVIMGGLGFTGHRGVDIAPQMVEAAGALSGVETRCVDFRTLEPEVEGAELVFAQALVHLFPKEELGEVVGALLNLGRRRVYVTTTVHAEGGEGWEVKAEGVERYRSRFTEAEFARRVGAIVQGHGARWRGLTFILVDCFDKRWINVVLERVEGEGGGQCWPGAEAGR